MGKDRPDRVHLLVGLEIEQLLGHGPPHPDGLVGLAGVGYHEVMECRVGRRRHLLVGYGHGVISHG
jgi:hypothetical protein